MNSRSYLIGATASVLLAGAAHSATSVSGAVNVTANTGIGASAANVSNSANFSGSPAALSTSATATAVSGSDTSTASGNVVASWASANSGVVDFTNYGWNVNPNSAALSANANLWGAPDWSYTFTATSAGTFTMKYAVTSTGSGFGLWGWNIGWTGVGGGQPLPGAAAYSPDTSGVFTRNVAAGQTYTIDLATNANISVAPGNNYVGDMNGTYNWSISGSAVPEPAEWAVLTVGLFCIGGAVRQRRSTAMT